MKAVANEALRAGLEHGAARVPSAYRVEVRALGQRPGIDLDDIQALLDRLDQGVER